MILTSFRKVVPGSISTVGCCIYSHVSPLRCISKFFSIWIENLWHCLALIPLPKTTGSHHDYLVVGKITGDGCLLKQKKNYLGECTRRCQMRYSQKRECSVKHWQTNRPKDNVWVWLMPSAANVLWKHVKVFSTLQIIGLKSFLSLFWFEVFVVVVVYLGFFEGGCCFVLFCLHRVLVLMRKTASSIHLESFRSPSGWDFTELSCVLILFL